MPLSVALRQASAAVALSLCSCGSSTGADSVANTSANGGSFGTPSSAAGSDVGGSTMADTAAAGAPGTEAGFPCEGDECLPIADRVAPLPKPYCPAAEPSIGEACDATEGECSYGESLTAHCRRFYACENGAWVVPENRQAECVTQPPGFCPEAPAHGAACVTGDLSYNVPCEYAEGVTCYCLGNPSWAMMAPGTWLCFGPPNNPRCPERLPNLGDGCADADQICQYGIQMQGCYTAYAAVHCNAGSWEISPTPCLL